jgi:hypothetical protein
VVEQTAEALAALDRPASRARLPIDQLVADALVVALGVVVGQVLVDGVA